MKLKFFFLFFCIILSGAAEGQTWCPTGAMWHYGYSAFFEAGYYKINYVGDTTINTIQCKILENKHVRFNPSAGTFDTLILNHEYTYADSNKVYIYRFNNFYTLYDFSAHVGDTIITPGTNQYSSGCDSIGAVKVDSIGTMNINGENLRYVVVSPTPTSHWGWNCRIVEKIGPLKQPPSSSNDYLFPNKLDNCGLVGDEFPEGGKLRCYVDDNFQQYSTGIAQTCEFIPTNINENGRLINHIAMYPNPTHSNLAVEFAVSETKTISIEIKNVLGETVYSETVKNAVGKQVKSIDVSGFSNGVYFLQVQNGQQRFSEKFIKQE
jgi:hypothetical protein